MTKGRLSFTFSVWIWSQKVNTINHGAWRLICYWKFLRRLYLSMQTYLFAENTWEQLADLLQKSNPWPCIGPHNPEVDRMLAVHLLCKTLLAQFIFFFSLSGCDVLFSLWGSVRWALSQGPCESHLKMKLWWDPVQSSKVLLVSLLYPLLQNIPPLPFPPLLNTYIWYAL